MSKILTFNFKVQIIRYNLHDPLFTSLRIGDMERGWGFASLQPTGSSGSGSLQVGPGSTENSTEIRKSKMAECKIPKLTLMIFAGE
jgi:hypothetical protein